MKRIVIYVHNEEQEALRPLAKKLTNEGCLINWHALKFPEVVKADQVLTLPKYVDRVTKIFEGTGVPVVAIEDDGSITEPVKKAPEVVAPIPVPNVVLPPADEPIMINVGELTPPPPLAIPPTPVLEPVKFVAPEPIKVDEPIILTVSPAVEDPKPAPPRKTRKAGEDSTP